MSPVILVVTESLRYYDTLNVLLDLTSKSYLEWKNITVDIHT